MPHKKPQETFCGLSSLKNKSGILPVKVFLNNTHPQSRFPMKGMYENFISLKNSLLEDLNKIH